MTPLGFLLLLICAVALLTVPRRMAIVPLLCGYLYMTVGQSLTVAGLNLYAIRVLILVGVLRVFLRGERLPRPLLGLDKAMIVWGIVALLTALFHESPGQIFINRGGLVLNQLGVYLLFRGFIRSEEDAMAACKYCITCLVPMAFFLAIEHVTHRNPFGALGGVPELAVERAGRFRTQGPFGNSIDAGLAGAMILPFVAIAWNRWRTLGWIGIATSLMMVRFSASSTPVSALGVICLGLMFWKFRANLRQVIYLGAIIVGILALVMKAPVYYLIARVDFAGGSTGWHRAALIEAAVTHFNEWWLVGSDFTLHWMPYGLEGNLYHCDITNHFIAAGVLGGLPLLICFLATVVCVWKEVSVVFRGGAGGLERGHFIGWALGVALLAHCTSFIAVNYFDQLLGLWYLHLAIIACLFEQVRNRIRETLTSTENEDDLVDGQESLEGDVRVLG